MIKADKMAENDYKINPNVVYPPPPSVATDEEFAAGVSTTASPTVKQCKDGLVTTDTNEQVITGHKIITKELLKKSSDIDVTSKVSQNTYNTAVRFRDKNNKETGAVNNYQDPNGEFRTVLEARNKDNYVSTVGVSVPFEGNSGGWGYASNTPAGAPNNAIITKLSHTTGTYSIPITFQVDSIVDNANPEAKTSAEVVFVAGTNNVNSYCGSMGIERRIDGESRAYLRTGTSASGTFHGDYLTLVTSSDGATWGEVPTPSVDMSGNKITTIDYINTKFQVVSTLPASPNANVFYFIPE